MSRTFDRLAIVAALALTVAGTVHLVDAPDTFGDATYLGLSFLANFGVAIIVAVGVLLGSRIAWGLGALFSIASIGMYVISRTIGLPGQSGEEWLEWSGLVAVISEAIALVATVLGLRLLASVRPKPSRMSSPEASDVASPPVAQPVGGGQPPSVTSHP
jgi:hypothetical protein